MDEALHNGRFIHGPNVHGEAMPMGIGNEARGDDSETAVNLRYLQQLSNQQADK